MQETGADIGAMNEWTKDGLGNSPRLGCLIWPRSLFSFSIFFFGHPRLGQMGERRLLETTFDPAWGKTMASCNLACSVVKQRL